MTYDETIEFLYSRLPAYHRIGKAAYKADLSNSIFLDKHFNQPHRRFKSIHVAGTNGKGSVSHMLASVLQESGYRTGLYTSPHLKDYRERIRINGKMIPEGSVITFVERNWPVIESLSPSFFELSVAMAFDYFAAERVDIAVIETGLGGRLDSTNIINPVISVITNIGLDHTDLLGDTIGKIAVEKAGIIKMNIPVIIGESGPDTAEIFRKKAAEMSSEIIFAEECFRCVPGNFDPAEGFRSFSLSDLRSGRLITGVTPLGGDYQSKNIQTTASAIEVMDRIISIPAENLAKGIRNVISNTGLMGRWQVLGNNPLTVCDTGHNRDGLEYVLRQLMALQHEHVHIVLGFVNDKDLGQILPLFPTEASYYFTKASVQRALDPAVLKNEAFKYGLSGDVYIDVQSAYSAARNCAGMNDIIFIGGSTFVVAEII